MLPDVVSHFTVNCPDHQSEPPSKVDASQQIPHTVPHSRILEVYSSENFARHRSDKGKVLPTPGGQIHEPSVIRTKPLAGWSALRQPCVLLYSFFFLTNNKSPTGLFIITQIA
jgi:hypothetical protein